MTKKLKIGRGWPKSAGRVLNRFGTSQQKHSTPFHNKIMLLSSILKKISRTKRRVVISGQQSTQYHLQKIYWPGHSHDFFLNIIRVRGVLKVHRQYKSCPKPTMKNCLFHLFKIYFFAPFLLIQDFTSKIPLAILGIEAASSSEFYFLFFQSIEYCKQ